MHLTRDEFIAKRNSVLRSGEPINSVEHLKGRKQQFSAIIDALKTPGKHVFIHGFRGVGKTSLAITASNHLSINGRLPITVNCESASTFSSVCESIILRATAYDPLSKSEDRKFNGGLSITGIGGINAGYEQKRLDKKIAINSVDDMLLYLESISANSNDIFTYIVIDEFDKLTDTDQHEKFASLIKSTSDKRLKVKYIFCGISENIESLFKAHQSVERQIFPSRVPQLLPQARLDIINDAERELGIKVKDGFKYRISQISDGFPSFIHLICEKMMMHSYDEIYGNPTIVRPQDLVVSDNSYNLGLKSATEDAEFSLVSTYKTALHRNGRSYERLIWAVADDELLEVNVEETWKNYRKICEQINFKNNDSSIRLDAAEKGRINTKLNELTKFGRGNILERPRRANFTFREKRMRAYARLCAARSDIILGPENPNIF